MDNSLSLDMSKEVQSDRRIIRNNEQIVESSQNDIKINNINSNKYASRHMGKMIVLSQKFNISLGPHYMFFILGFIMVLTVSSLLVYCSFTLIKTQQKGTNTIRVISPIMWLWVNIAYLITALSDPGIYSPLNSSQNQQNQESNLRNCSACKIDVPKNVRHCFTCDVCIVGLDHHCPWMSKCVGKNNLVPFYAFLAGLFLTMGLFWVNIFLVLSR